MHRDLNISRPIRTPGICVLMLACSLVFHGAGCSKSGPQTGAVTGVITINGKPGANLMLTFTPTSGGRCSEGGTDDQGRYELNFNAMTQGALVGEHSVSIAEVPKPQTEVKVNVIDGGAGGAKVDAASVAAYVAEQKKLRTKPSIPAKYNRQSELRANVQKGENKIDFDLKF